MSAITIFLLALIGVLIPANALLWFTGKKNKKARPAFETTFLKTPKTSGFQNNETQAIQEQLMQLSEYLRKNNGFLTEIKQLKTGQESIYSRINALEEATIQIQNELNEIKALKSDEPLSPKRGKPAKGNRIKILEEYLKKT